MAIGPLPPVISEIQANSGQPGKTLGQQTAAGSLLDVQASATTEPATAILPETTLIEKAVAEALGRQGGMAPLYAVLAELAEAPDLPDPVKAAVNTLLAFRLADGDVTPERIAQAIRTSGLFHEAVAAGKMATILPPALRQALGNSSAERPQAAVRPTAPGAPPTTLPAAAKPASAASTSPSSSLGASVSAAASTSAAQVYGRLGPTPASMAAPGAPQAPGAGNVVVPSASQGASDRLVAATPTVASATSAIGLPTQPAAKAEPSTSAPVAQMQSTPVGEAPPPSAIGSGPAVEAELPLVTGGTRDAPLPTQAQATSTASTDARVPPPQTAAGAAPVATPTSSAMPPVPERGNQGSGQASVSPSPPSSSIPTPSAPQTPTSDSLQVDGPARATISSAAISDGAQSSRSFAPWTPGRPLTPPSSLVSPEARAAASPLASDHPAPSAPIASSTGEAVAARPHSDRAPFVPSTVESLPTASPGQARPAPTSPAPSSAGPSAPQPAANAPPSASPASSPPQMGAPLGQAAAQPLPLAMPEGRPVASAGNEISSARGDRQPSSQPPALSIAPPAIGVDLKGALEGLRRELVTWLGRNADVMASLDGARDDGAARRVDRPQPPRKGAVVRGQPAVPLLGTDETEPSSTEMLAGRALGETERSLSRVFLHQAATAESRDAKAAQPVQAFVLEIPIAGPNGTSIAQLRIERDDHAPSEPGLAPRRVFQVDIAFDIAPLGPVAVRVGLMDGRRVAVGVWCESDDGLVRMEAERENIVLGLEQEGMVVAGVDLHRGHPPEGRDETAAVPSHRLDLQL